MIRSSWLKLIVMGAITALVSSPVAVANANETAGLGGTPNFSNGAEFPFISGIESSIKASFYVENLGSGPIELGISHGAPRGVIIEPAEGQKTLFEKGEGGVFEFEITVTEPVVPGSYRTTINLSETDPELPDRGGSFYVPALSGDVVIDVFGASATATLSTISALTGEPAVGDLALFYIGSRGTEVQINEATAARLETFVVPGNYKFTFSVPGLQRQEFEFSIDEDEELELVFEIPTLEFLGVGAIPTRDDRGFIQAISLNMDVFNNLDTLEEQIFFQANISRDGELVEEFVIAALPNLPREGSILRANYVREDGFEQGDWEFEFQIVGDTFAISSEEVVIINSPGIFQSYLQEIVIAIGALVIIGLLLPRKWWDRILRRTAKKTDDVDQKTEVQKPKTSSKVETKPAEAELQLDLVETPKPKEKAPGLLKRTAEKLEARKAKNLEAKKIAALEKAKAKTEAEARAKAEAEARSKDEAEARSKAQAAARAKAKTEAEARAKAAADKTQSEAKQKQVRETKATKRVKTSSSKPKPTEAWPKKESATASSASELAPSSKGDLSRIVEIRKRLEELENEGVRSLEITYKIASKFVEEGEPVIEWSTGQPYTAKQVRDVEELRRLKSELEQKETPALRGEAMKILLRERFPVSRRS